MGTKLDLLHEREVFYDEASHVVEMQFGAYIEVSTTQTSTTGVDEIQRLLGEWTGIPFCSSTDHRIEEPRLSLSQTPPRDTRIMRANSCASAEAATQDKSELCLSPKRKPCIRASVWLYDPTEDHPPSPEHDVKLRPISRALFEIRGAGQEKMKSIAKYKDREVNKLIQRSKYYGPTESSRHMRWQEEQKKKTKQPTGTSSSCRLRPRSASQGAITDRGYDRHREHELLNTKSFAQTTELLRQRKLELMAKKALLAAGSKSSSSSRKAHSTSNGTRSLANPHIARDGAQLQKRNKKHASTKLSSVPEEERDACEAWVPDMQSCTIASSPRATTCTQTQTRSELSVDTEAPVVTEVACAMDLISPGADHDAALPTPVPIAHLQSPIPPVTSPPRFSSSKRRAVSFNCVSSSLAFAFEFGGAAEESADIFAAAWDTDKADGTADTVADKEAVDGLRGSGLDLDEPQNELTSGIATTMTTAEDDAFDCSDIDDMLDYFDGVSLPI